MNRAIELSHTFLESQPVAAARALEHLPAAEAAAFLEHAPPEHAGAALAYMQPARAIAVLLNCSHAIMASLLVNTSADARSVLLRGLPKEHQVRALGTLNRHEAAMLRRHLSYDPGTVGAWMEAPSAAFRPEVTVADCLGRLRGLGARIGSLVLVVDAERRLLGAVGIEDLIGADPGSPLSEVMRKEVPSLSPQAPLSTVVTLSVWDSLLSLPVRDRHRRLVGILHFEAIRRGLHEDSETSGGLRLNIIMAHIARALVVTVAGLLHTATADHGISRMAHKTD